MITFLVTWTFVIWLSVVVVLSIFIGFGVWQAGGWDQFIDFQNRFVRREDEEKWEVLQIQWILTISIVFWPIILPLGYALRKHDEGS